MKHSELVHDLKTLRLHTVAQDYAEIARQCERDKRTFEQYLHVLAKAEILERQRKRTVTLLRAARFPRGKTLDTYDYTNRQGIDPKQTARLTEGRFVQDGSNVVLFGSFGVGKSHLAEGIGRELCHKGFKCLFVTVQALVTELMKAHTDLSLTRYFKRLDNYDLLILDELGYVTFTKDEADLFFQLISHRYERRSIMVTTNLTYSEWDKVFISPLTTMGAVDRMIHKCETFNITGPSWRAAKAKERAEEKKKDLETAEAVQ